MHAGLCKNISTYVHTRSNVFFSFDIGTSIWYSLASNVCIYSISVFLSFHFAIKFKAEMRNSNITESNLSVPRIAVIDAGQEKWITEWTNGCLNNFGPRSFFLLFFSLNCNAEKSNWQLFHWVHLILAADRLRSKPHYDTKVMYKITMFLSRILIICPSQSSSP